ncbi:MAG: oxygen-independent coproporphyrinogen III oxidase [Pseudomonadota bacterium]
MAGPVSVTPNIPLIEKYGVNGPRYTSYPSALNFSEAVADDAFDRAVRTSNDELIPAPLSLYVHIPFCRTLCYYCGCHKKVTRNPGVVSGYLTALNREIERKGAMFDRDREVKQLHFGGGTPTFLNAVQRAGLMSSLARDFTLIDHADRDYGIEIDPRSVHPHELGQIASLGFNRVSFGVQDTNPAVQEAVNRVHSLEELELLVLNARRFGFKTVSFDLIYGLPRQTPASFMATLKTVTALNPDSLSVFSYAHLPALFPAQRLLSDRELPDAASRLAMFAETIAELQSAGYEYIGMDHFALPSSHLARARDRHDMHRCFQGYASGRHLDTLGLGVSAISRIGDGYYQNQKDLRAYAAAMDGNRLAIHRGYELSDGDCRVAAVIDELMCYGSLDKDAWSRTFQADFDRYFAHELLALNTLADDELVNVHEHRIDVTAQGRLFLRSIAACFDRQVRPEGSSYSSTV